MIDSSIIAIVLQTIIVPPPIVITRSEPIEDNATWQIIADGGEFHEDAKSLKKGAIIARQRLVPKQLAVVAGDIERADGKDRWAKAGDQLFGAKVGEYDAFCVIKSKFNITLGMMVVPTRTRLVKQDCFVDTDLDGKLDKRFEADPGIGVLPNVARSKPQAFYDLAPVEYSVISPTEFTEDSWVEIQFRGGGKSEAKPPRFRVSYRYDGKTRKLSVEATGKTKTMPSELEILGSRIGLARSENGQLTASVLQPMNSSFGVITSLRY